MQTFYTYHVITRFNSFPFSIIYAKYNNLMFTSRTTFIWQELQQILVLYVFKNLSPSSPTLSNLDEVEMWIVNAFCYVNGDRGLGFEVEGSIPFRVTFFVPNKMICCLQLTKVTSPSSQSDLWAVSRCYVRSRR